VLVAELRGIGDDKIATIIAGQRPGGSRARRSRRSRLGRVLPELTYQQAVELFGEEGTADCIYLVALYCMVSVTLNGSDVPYPGANEITRWTEAATLICFVHRQKSSYEARPALPMTPPKPGT
jgi:hypothetical protein